MNNAALNEDHFDKKERFCSVALFLKALLE